MCICLCPCIRPALFADRVQKQSMHLPPPSWSLIPFYPNRNQVFLEKMTDSRVGVECICDEPGTLCQKVSVQRQCEGMSKDTRASMRLRKGFAPASKNWDILSTKLITDCNELCTIDEERIHASFLIINRLTLINVSGISSCTQEVAKNWLVNVKEVLELESHRSHKLLLLKIMNGH